MENIIYCEWELYKLMVNNFLIDAPTMEMNILDYCFARISEGFICLRCDADQKASAVAALELVVHAKMLREVTLGMAE